MKFSVVTISFNQVDFIRRTIESVISQQGVEIEYIVCDPGSTDGSREIIEEFRDRIAYIVYDPDKGPADGLNKGFEFATGEVFCYLNSDDTFAPDSLRRVASYLEMHPEIDVLCGHGWVIDENDSRLRRVWSEPYLPLFVAYGAAVQIQPSTFIRQDAFRHSGGFNNSNRSNWDGELLVDLYKSGAKIRLFHEFLSNYRLHGTSITNTDKLDHLISVWRKRCFEKLMGRKRNYFDPIIGKVLRLSKHFLNPTGSVERVTKGPIRKRG